MPKSFEKAVRDILRTNDDYAPDAYDFMRQALDEAAQQFDKGTNGVHLSAEELYMGVAGLALKLYGPMAAHVLSFWGIDSSEDVGKIVFLLIEAGIFGKQEDDNIEQFKHLPDLQMMLDAPYNPRIASKLNFLQK